MDKQELGLKISKLRRFKNISQTEFAEMLDISVSALSKIERGVNYPRVNTAQAMAEHLELSISRLLSPNDIFDKNNYIEEIICLIQDMEIYEMEMLLELIKLYNSKKDK